LVGELAPPSLAGWFLVPSLPAPLFFYSFIIFFLLSLPARWLRVVCFAFEGGRAVVDWWAGVVLKSVFIYGGRA
jgi:hypothetical protein